MNNDAHEAPWQRNPLFRFFASVRLAMLLLAVLIVAIIEAALALLFFMHLWENRGLKWFVLVFTVSVILGMQYGWTDSFRILDGAPWAK